MKDAKGHGSDPRSAHSTGVDQIGRVPVQPGLWYHGSPAGEPGSNGPVHVGTHEAARQALEARIGVPADGREWDGSREYGSTLLAGRLTQQRLEEQGIRPKYTMGTGYNVDAPDHDYYAKDRPERAKFGSGTAIADSARPAIHSYEIHGNMSNNTGRPTTDSRANGMAKRLKNQGTYYKNSGEDSGSVSAVVPSSSFLVRKG